MKVVPIETMGKENDSWALSRKGNTRPDIMTRTGSSSTALMRYSNLIHRLQHVKAHILMIWMELITAIETIGMSTSTYLLSSSILSISGCLRMTSNPIVTNKKAYSHTQITIELNARKFLRPIQLFSRVQWWSNPTTQLLQVPQCDALGFLCILQVSQCL